MPPIEIGPARAVMAVQAGLERKVDGKVGGGSQSAPVRSTEGAPSKAGPSVETEARLDPGAPPVDAERVATIRKAVESGTYPVIPTRIADAIIAAGVLLRSPRA